MPFLIVANWKMNGTRSSFIDFMDKLNSKSSGITSKLVICPPFTSFPDNIELRNNINIGAQNCHNKKSGSYTGEISAAMLKELGCTYVILGHSERINETDNEIKLKAEAAIESGLHPIICVGENLEDYKNEKTKEVIERQCKNRLPIHGEYTIAYEPIWAIGTGNIPSNDAIAEVIGLLHNHYLSEKLVTSSSVSFQRVTLESRKEEWIPVSSTGMTEDNAGGLIKSCTSKQRIIYGGSVNLENIENLLNISNLSGVLIGSASLDFDHFYGIVQKVEKRKYNI